jgi:exopolysaccharide production protein ExoQ
MKNFLLAAEKWYTVLSLLLYSGGPLTVLLSGGRSEGDASGAQAQDVSLILFLFMVNYTISLILLILRWRKAIHTYRQDYFFWILLGYILLSVLWSETPAVTLRQTIALIGTTLFGVYLASRFSLKQQLQLLAQMFGLAILLSLLFIVVLPQFGIMSGIHAGSWRGIYTHKNVLGKMMTLSTLVFGQLAINFPEQRRKLLLGVGLSASLILCSRSTSSIINLSILFGALCFLVSLKFFPKGFQQVFPIFTGAMLFCFCLGTYLITNLENILKLLGKDPTLTGRTAIWQTAWDMLEQKFIFGYGYGGFLENLDIQSRLSSNIQLGVHNGFLEFALDMGVLGLLLILIWIAAILFRASLLLTQNKNDENYWPLMFLLNLVLVNMSESTFMVRNNLFCVVLISLNFSIKLMNHHLKISAATNRNLRLIIGDR